MTLVGCQSSGATFDVILSADIMHNLTCSYYYCHFFTPTTIGRRRGNHHYARVTSLCGAQFCVCPTR